MIAVVVATLCWELHPWPNELWHVVPTDSYPATRVARPYRTGCGISTARLSYPTSRALVEVGVVECRCVGQGLRTFRDGGTLIVPGMPHRHVEPWPPSASRAPMCLACADVVWRETRELLT